MPLGSDTMAMAMGAGATVRVKRAVAVALLSVLSPAALQRAVLNGDADSLTLVPGIGKKTAERMVLELRDKLPASAAGVAATPAVGGRAALTPLDQDVLSALGNLGCAPAAAEAAVRKAKLEGATGFEPLFRRALELVR